MSDLVTFRTPFNRGSARCFNCSGRRTRDQMSVVDDGPRGKHLEKVGETDQYQVIQSFRDEVDIKKIVERCVASGDMSLLQRVQGVYTDTTGLPKDLMSMENLRLQVEGLYDAQSAEYKAQHDLLTFVEETLSQALNAPVGGSTPIFGDSNTEGVESNEQKQ